MKKFITVSPFQPKGRLEAGIYEAVDNRKLRYDKETRFPIIPVIAGCTEVGEEIEVLVIEAEYENAEYNTQLLEEELASLCQEKELRFSGITRIKVPYDDTLDSHLSIFEQLIDHMADGDTLYACISYGKKPMPMVIAMGLNYAHRIHKDVTIECVVYGNKDFTNGKMCIYDITSLLYMDEIVRLMAEQKVSNPAERIKLFLQ